MVGALAGSRPTTRSWMAAAHAVMERLGLTLPSDDPMDNNKAQMVELSADHRALETVEQLLAMASRMSPRRLPAAKAGLARQ
jgi:hypothetical protein